MAEKQITGNQTEESAAESEIPTPVPQSDDGITETSQASAGGTKHVRTHDPRGVIEDLRNHLAAHDRCVAFLFGAGTSSSINVAPPPSQGEKPQHQPLIPEVLALTEICKGAVSDKGENHAKAWEMLAEQCEQIGQAVNIENILSRVRTKLDAIGDGETLVGLRSQELAAFEKTICSTIATTVIPPEENIPDRIPHDGFVDWVQKVHRTAPLEIFTTNYDILLERAFERARVPVFDGFVGAHEPFFYPDCLDDEDLLPNPKWIRLWKLHGSVNWKSVEESGRKRIVRDRPSTTGEMILPSHRKYDESRKQPFTGYMDRLARVLRSEHALLIACGYGFRDEHINAVLYGALDGRATANVIALHFEELNQADDVVKEALRRSNLSVIGPNAAVISGIWGEWRLTQPVDKKTHAFMDTAFDSNAIPDDAGSAAATTDDLSGKMRLGGFSWFCRFLSEMGPASQ